MTKTADDAPFADTATASPSGLPVTYSVPTAEQSVATVDAVTGLVTLTGVPGTAHLVADAAATAGGNFVFTFQRALASKNANTKVVIEVGTDLGTWPHDYDGDTAPQVAISTGLDADHETVTLTLPSNPDTTKFARLKVITTAP